MDKIMVHSQKKMHNSQWIHDRSHSNTTTATTGIRSESKMLYSFPI